MKLFFLIILSVLVLEGCGKKSDPKYQSKLNQEIKTIS
jgi:PBP1b-binding outer membrane lipoprotein LpoB